MTPLQSFPIPGAGLAPARNATALVLPVVAGHLGLRWLAAPLAAGQRFPVRGERRAQALRHWNPDRRSRTASVGHFGQAPKADATGVTRCSAPVIAWSPGELCHG